MGNSITSVKNVMENEHSPLNHTPESSEIERILADPRSPTNQFTRTPIEVPLPSRRRMLAVSDPIGEDLFNDSNVFTVTDTDQHVILKKLRKLHIFSEDPRSPTIGIIRTPIQVAVKNESQKCDVQGSSSGDSFLSMTSIEKLLLPTENGEDMCSSAKSACLLDPRSPSTEVVRTPIQMAVVAQNAKVFSNNLINQHSNDKPVENKLEENDLQLNSCKVVQTSTPITERISSGKKNKENIEFLAKKLFSTPDSKEVVAPNSKVRTPLGTMSANGNSPHNILRIKQMRGINQELGRAFGIENAPPDTTVTRNTELLKYRSTSDWDDSTFII